VVLFFIFTVVAVVATIVTGSPARSPSGPGVVNPEANATENSNAAVDDPRQVTENMMNDEGYNGTALTDGAAPIGNEAATNVQ